ncbi:hypothetical protein U9M48_001670 [Paspalum notatum var. saurae]|uniref:Cyclin-dependent kinase inhibitor domain-containing protein n=1 Tax=Paspalum notatum var. saurae TaxID=547442 RepID=A0AAQ3SGW4_PASNO
MGKCVRIRGSKPPAAPSSPAEAAACLTLRSGRRVPVAVADACSSPRTSSRRHRGSAAHRCGGAEKAAMRACGGGPRRSSPRGRVLVVGAQQLCGGGRPDAEQQLPSQAEADNLHGANGCGDDDSFQPSSKNTPLDGDELVVEMEVKQEHESKGVAGQPAPSPVPPGLEAEMEAFFAAAELAERRRFAEAYNYDVALDRPLEGRFEWAPVMSTCGDEAGDKEEASEPPMLIDRFPPFKSAILCCAPIFVIITTKSGRACMSGPVVHLFQLGYLPDLHGDMLCYRKDNFSFCLCEN